MKKLQLLAFSALLAGSWLTASAEGELGTGTSVLPVTLTTTTTDFSYWLVDGGYATNSMYGLIFLTYDGAELTFTESGQSASLQMIDVETSQPAGSQKPALYLGSVGAKPTDTSSQYLMINLYPSNTTGMVKGKKYSVTIPAGVVQDSSGNTNAEQTVTFTWATAAYLTTAANWTPVPTLISTTAYGGYYSAEDLEDVTYKDPNNSFTAPTQKFPVFAVNKAAEQIINISDKVSVSDGTLHFDLSDLTSGNWILWTGSGLFTYTNSAGTLYTNSPNGTVTYQIMSDDELDPLPEAPTGFYANGFSTPLAEYNTTFPTTLKVSWNGQPIKIASDAPEVTYELNGDTYPCTVSIAQGSLSGQNTYTLDIKPTTTPTTPGYYTLNIPEGVVESGKYTNETVTKIVRFTPTTNNYVMNPAPGAVAIDGFEALTIEFPNATSVEKAEGEWPSNPTLTTPSSDGATTLVYGETIKTEGNKIIIPISEAELGNYVLTIPQGLFVIDDQNINSAFSALTFNVWDGMSSATVVEGTLNISSNVATTGTTYYSSLSDINPVLTWDYQTITPEEDFAVTVNISGT